MQSGALTGCARSPERTSLQFHRRAGPWAFALVCALGCASSRASSPDMIDDTSAAEDPADRPGGDAGATDPDASRDAPTSGTNKPSGAARDGSVVTLPKDTAARAPAAPDTLLLSGPLASTPSREVTIVVTSDTHDVTYVCSLDGTPVASCGEHTQLHDLALGAHLFRIAARDADGRIDPTPLELDFTVIEPPAEDLASVQVGYNHACAIDADGQLWCWGANAFGQLGTGDTEARDGPVQIGDANDWDAVTLGRFHSCGLRAGGALYCWGASAFGQSGSLDERVLEPQRVPAPAGHWTAVSAGDWHSCGLTDDGAAYCFGYNLLGRLGDGTGAGSDEDPDASIASPSRVLMSVGAVAISAAAAHSCAIGDDGAVYCWGSDEQGELGSAAPDACALAGSSLACSLTPIQLPGDRSYLALGTGGSHSCAIDVDARLYCWGEGEYGQLGQGEPASSLAPLQVEGRYAAVAAGAFHTCALSEDGALLCFGDNSNAQLGYGTEGQNAPVETGGGARWTSVSSGALGSCAVDGAHDGYCWGKSAYVEASGPLLIVLP